MTISKIITLSAASILAALAFSSSASAKSAEKIVDRIPVAQSQLQTKQGIAKIHNRVVKAAAKICDGDALKTKSRVMHKDVEICIATVIEDAYAPKKLAVFASFNDSLSHRSRTISSRKLSKNKWSLEAFKATQTEAEKLASLSANSEFTIILLP